MKNRGKSKIRLHGLGYGDRDEVEAKLPGPGPWVLICDEEAAMAGEINAWHAAQGDKDTVVAEYLAMGGTISEVFVTGGEVSVCLNN